MLTVDYYNVLEVFNHVCLGCGKYSVFFIHLLELSYSAEWQLAKLHV